MKLHVWITVVAACFSQTIRCTSDSEYESDSSVSLEEGPQPPDRVVRQSDVDSMERQQISVQLNAIDYAIQIEELFLIVRPTFHHDICIQSDHKTDIRQFRIRPLSQSQDSGLRFSQRRLFPRLFIES